MFCRGIRDCLVVLVSGADIVHDGLASIGNGSCFLLVGVLENV